MLKGIPFTCIGAFLIGILMFAFVSDVPTHKHEVLQSLAPEQAMAGIIPGFGGGGGIPFGGRRISDNAMYLNFK